MPAKPQQLFEYLLAVKNLTSPPIRDYRDYEYFKDINELPVGDGCYLFGEGEDDDAWLEVHKQEIAKAPNPPMMLKKWIKDGEYSNEKKRPEIIEEIRHPIENSKSDEVEYEVEKFNDDPVRVKRFKEYLSIWDEWAKETIHKKSVQQLYSYFFSLAQRFEREGDMLELAFGHGILNWKHGEANINHPILITYMELEFDAKKGRAILRPTSKGTVLETEMIAGLDLQNISLISKMRKRVKESSHDIDPTDIEAITPLFKEFVQTLHPDGRISTEESKSFDHPEIYPKGILFLRKRSSQLIKEDLQDVINKLNEGFIPPRTITSIVNPDVSQASIDNDQQLETSWKAVGEDLLFPLPANEEQKEIARRLSKNFGVTVQGPPGTGKSHTIANLISHLLAHGKRILVTSQKERALRVLADKIPESIRSLCVPVLGGDTKSLQDIEDSIRSISDNMASLDIDILEKKIKGYEEHLKDVKRKTAELKLQLRQAAENQHKKIPFNNQLLTPLEISKKLTESKDTLDWIPDDLSINDQPPLSNNELVRFYTLLSELEIKDRNLIDHTIPDETTLYSPYDFKKFIEEGHMLRDAYNSVKDTTEHHFKSIDDLKLKQIISILSEIINHESLLNTKFTTLILGDYFNGGELKKTWEDFYTNSNKTLDEISKIKRELDQYNIVTADVPLHVLRRDIEQIKDHLSRGKKLNKVFFMTSGRKLKPIIQNTLINDKPIENLQDVEIITRYISLKEVEKTFKHKWNHTMISVDGPSVDTENLRYISFCKSVLSKIELTKDLVSKVKKLQELTKDLVILPNNFSWFSVESYKEYLTLCVNAQKVIEKDKWEEKFNEKLQHLKNYLEEQKVHPICIKLVEAFEGQNVSDWEILYTELKNLKMIKEKHLECDQLYNRLLKVAPLWAKQLLEKMGSPLEFPKNWREAWEWRQLNHWITELNKLDPEIISKEIEENQREERKTIEDLVTLKTWKNQIERITEQEKRALYAWKQKIKRIGKGTSKYIERYRREAKAEMDQCRSAIPVWIMPVDRVIENFSVSEKKFDVIIVDESSQCDLFSLSVLLRAEKAVIVGDDEQISPAAVGVHQDRVYSLIQHYLDGVPQANSLDMQTSLYDVAARIFPGKLMLKEHFRCVPEIIQFSNDLSYGGEIIPLRIPKESERMKPPVLAKRVPGYRSEGSKAINEVEAEAIVEDIKEFITNPNYEGKTIGVISLLGKDQAQYIENLLRAEIGEEEIINRKIICGDAYDFQGDERDIICLSLVVADNVRYSALTRKDAQQRFNVAASRAKNQMRLYHSVDLEDLSAQDLRYRLLEYCLNPKRITEEVERAEELCESQFEIDVFRMIVARGYAVRPQVQVGKYRIDLVVEGLNSRLAVECDGDQWHGIDRWEEDMERQRTLERVGWTFWRVRGSEFYRDRNKALESLWAKLDEMNIQPRELISSRN